MDRKIVYLLMVTSYVDIFEIKIQNIPTVMSCFHSSSKETQSICKLPSNLIKTEELQLLIEI